MNTLAYNMYVRKSNHSEAFFSRDPTPIPSNCPSPSNNFYIFSKLHQKVLASLIGEVKPTDSTHINTKNSQ